MPRVYVYGPASERIIVPPKRDAIRVEDPASFESACTRPLSDPLSDVSSHPLTPEAAVERIRGLGYRGKTSWRIAKEYLRLEEHGRQLRHRWLP